MAYNFAQYANGINLYFIIDMVILVTVFAIMLSFFVYKRNMKVFFLLLLGAVLDVLVNVLSELLGGAVLAISKYVMHFVVVFDIVAACVVYQTTSKTSSKRFRRQKVLKRTTATTSSATQRLKFLRHVRIWQNKTWAQS